MFHFLKDIMTSRNLIFTILISKNCLAVDIDYKGYMRASSGSNSFGGQKFSLNNKNSSGNEFRLGNESNYGESTFLTHLISSSQNKSHYFDASLTLAFDQAGSTQYSDTSSGIAFSKSTSDKYVNTLQVIEAFVQGGKFNDSSISYWAGKRFYRSSSMHINDFFYFADMSGNGAGITDLPILSSHLNIAYLVYSDTTIKGSNGYPTKQVLDFQLKDLKITQDDGLHLWFSEGYSAPGNGLDESGTFTDFKAASGTAVGAKWSHTFSTATSNNFAIVYGSSVMESLTLNNNAVVISDVSKKKNRIRVVNDLNSEINQNWGLELGFVFEKLNLGTETNNQSVWQSIGARPIYYINDNYQIAFEVGQSSVKDESEFSSDGQSIGQRDLTRITVAPAVVIGKGFYQRPVIRAYLTHSNWNSANKNTQYGVTRGFESALAGINNVSQFGVQTEVWF